MAAHDSVNWRPLLVEPSEPLKGLKSPAMADLGFLLVGHGTRSTRGQDQFRELYAKFAEQIRPAESELAFLELAQPSIPQAIERLASKGTKQFVCMPLLLFTAGHALRDIPEAVQEAAAANGLQCINQTPSLGTASPILNLSALRFRQTICQSADTNCLNTGICSGKYCAQTALIMVGRGSKSDSATDEMRKFTALRQTLTPTAWSKTAFIYAQSPTVAEAFNLAAQTPYRKVVVQPHLLFEGELLESLRMQVAEQNAKNSQQRWSITHTLGVDQALAKSLCDIARSGRNETIQV